MVVLRHRLYSLSILKKAAHNRTVRSESLVKTCE
jgi:hypothetical protein